MRTARLSLVPLALTLAGCPGEGERVTDAPGDPTGSPGGDPTADPPLTTGPTATTGLPTTDALPTSTTTDVSTSMSSETGETATTGPVDPSIGTSTTGPDETTVAVSTTGPTPECSDAPPMPAGPEVALAPAFAELYKVYELGPVPGIPEGSRLGGCVIAFDDPNTLLVAGDSEAASGKIYKVGVERGNCDHIVGYSGSAEVVAATPYVDANLAYVQSGLLFYTAWPVNQIGQLLPGAAAPAVVTDVGPLGIENSVGGLGFVPPGYADEGDMRVLTWSGGKWYHLDRAPAGELFTLSNPVHTATLSGGPGGFAYVPKGSPGFEVDHVIVSEWSSDLVGVYEVDPAGDPMPATRKDFFTAFPQPWGAYFEPLTGDFMFLTWGQAIDRIYIVQGFEPPPPIPQ